MVGLVVVGLVLVALTLVVGPGLIEQAVTARVQSAAARRGVDVTWHTMTLDSAGATLAVVRVEHPAMSVHIPALRVEVAPLSVLRGEPSITAVRVVAPTLDLRLDAELGALAQGAGEGGAGGAGGGGELPVVTVENLSVQGHGRGVRLHGEAASVALRPAGGGWAVSASGWLDVEGAAKIGGTVEGTLDRAGLALRLASEDGVAVWLRRSGAWVRAAAASLKASRDGFAAVLDGVQVSAWPVTVEGGRVEVSGGGRWQVRWVGGTAQLARSLPAVVEGLIADAGEALGPPRAGAVVRGAASDRLTRLWAESERVAVEVDELTVDLPGLPRLLGARARWDHGRLDARAVVAGGEVSLAADFTPGRWRPDAVVVRAEGVGLAPFFARRLPAAPPERAERLGRVDGALDAWVAVAGLDGPVGAGALRVDGAVRWREGRVEMAGVSEAPVDGIDLRVEGGVQWEPGEQFTWAGEVALGAIAVEVEGRLVDPLVAPAVTLRLRGRPIACADAFAALPKGLLGPYDRARLSGQLAPKVDLWWPVRKPAFLELEVYDLFKSCKVEHLDARPEGWPPATVDGAPAPSLDDVGWLDARFVMPVREGTSGEVLVGPGTPGFVPLATLPPWVGAAMYQSEEGGFWRNNAIDKYLLARAIRIDLEAGRFVYGGSTVTQQLVKNLFLTRRKTIARKLQELLVSMRITQAISRHRVLELYVNCIEFGPDVYGIGAAAQYYFQKPASALSPREAVFLAMLKPAPQRGAAYRKRGFTPTNPWWIERAETLMQRLVENGQITAAKAEAERPYALRWVDRVYVRDAGRGRGREGEGEGEGESLPGRDSPAP
ncbi:MAG: transglycosylase domain-containing protein [bacterium]